MAIALEHYDEIFSRPGRPTTGDDGFELSDTEEKAFDRAWTKVADDLGVEQLPDQPTEKEIRNS
jgi:hypothetical protein